MRQAGILAAAGLYALRNHFPKLEEDHRAKALAAAVSSVEGVAAAGPETNIVMIDLREPRLDPPALLATLERRGVRMVQFGPRRLRAVTHLDVDDAGIEQASSAFSEAVGELLN
jgi:threonine aldolase